VHTLEPAEWRSAELALEDFLELYRWLFRTDDPSILDWTQTMRIRPRITDAPVRDDRPDAPARNTVIFGPAGTGDTLSHPDRSVDIVVLGERRSAATLAEARRVARDVVVLWAEDGTGEAPLSVEWLRDPELGAPAVSVVVHTCNGTELLDACLRSLYETTPTDAAVEIIVASTHDTAAAAQAWSERLNLTYVPADTAHDSVAACNLGAHAAAGGILVFLSEDTLALPGWLRPLVRALRDEPDVGAVGGRLLGATGRLEAAGGVVFADGSRESFGRGAADPDAPLYGTVRDVHYVSAALLATRAGLFRSLGGCDSRFHAGDYWDVDYCFRVRAAGRRVLYHPQSAIVRRGEPAAGNAGDDSDRFRRRWAAVLASHPPVPKRFDDATWQRLGRVA
jgi:GT2 family glycosyltransferase